MPIQNIVDEHTQDKLQARYTIAVNSETGSFKMPKGSHINLRDCSDATLTSNEGDNEVSFVRCNSVTIENFSDGVIRTEDSKSIQKATFSKAIAVFSYPDSVQDMNATDSEVDLVGCDSVQSAKFTNTILRSRENTYQSLTLAGGMHRLDQDEIQKGTFQAQSNIQGLKLQIKDDTTIDQCFPCILTECKADGDLTITDSHFVDISGSYQGKITASGAELISNFEDTQIQDDFSVSDGSCNLAKVQMQAKAAFQNASINVQDSLVTNEFSFDTGELMMLGSSLKKTTTINTAQAYIKDNTFTDAVSISDSSVQSIINSGADFTHNGGTIDSSEDTYSDFTLSKMIGINLVYKTTMDDLKADGTDSATLTLMEVQRQDTNISNFAKVEMSFGKGQDLTISDCDMFVANDENFQDVDIQDCQMAVFNNCTMGTVSASGIGTLLVNGGTATEIDADTCGFVNTASCNAGKVKITKCVLAVTKECGDLTSTDSNLVDKGSTFTTASDCNMMLNESTVTAATKCNIQAKEGDITAAGSNVQSVESTVSVTDKSMVTAKGGDVANADGLSVGTDIDLTTSAGVLNFDGADLTLQNNIGDITLQSTLKDVNVLAPAGNIDSHALLNISETAAGSILETATTTINNQSSGTISYNAVGNATMEAGGTATVSATGAATLSGAATTVAGSTSIDLSSPIIREN